MNDTPPCPNATPRTDAERLNWFRGHDAIIVVPADFARKLERELAQEREGHLSTQRTLVKLTKAQLSHSTQLAEAISPTAPLPTVAPHLDGERIAAKAALLRLFKGEYRESSDRHSDSLLAKDYMEVLEAALTQLAGEVERLKVWEKDRTDQRNTAQAEADRIAEISHERWQELTDLRQKLAASERECVRLKEERDRAVIGSSNMLDLRNKEITKGIECADALATAKLDADALAGALQDVYDNVMSDSPEMWGRATAALTAHRARGAAGGNKQ